MYRRCQGLGAIAANANNDGRISSASELRPSTKFVRWVRCNASAYQIDESPQVNRSPANLDFVRYLRIVLVNISRQIFLVLDIRRR
jgi:hypothetical protein